jgi:hypothetical protein
MPRLTVRQLTESVIQEQALNIIAYSRTRLGAYGFIREYGTWKEAYRNYPFENLLRLVARTAIKAMKRLEDRRGTYGTDWRGVELSLVTLNDSGKSFAKIADIIESKPKGLFKVKR